MPQQSIIAISAQSLASLSHDALIALYNAESRRLHGTEPHLVDESCTPGYIIGLFGSLARRAELALAERSNEAASLAQVPCEPPREAENDLGSQGKLHGSNPFSLMR